MNNERCALGHVTHRLRQAEVKPADRSMLGTRRTFQGPKATRYCWSSGRCPQAVEEHHSASARAEPGQRRRVGGR